MLFVCCHLIKTENCVFQQIDKTSVTGKHSTNENKTKIPAIKYNVKIIKRDSSPRKTVRIERKNILSEKNHTSQSEFTIR